MGFVIRLLGFLALVALSLVMALVLGTLYSLPIFLMRVYLGPGSLFDWVPLLVALTHATLLVLVILLRRVPRVFGKIVLYSFLALLLSYPSYLATIPLSGHGWEYGLLIGVPFLAAVLFPRVLVYVFELAWKIFSAMALHLGGLIASLLNRAVGSISPGIGVHVAGIEVVSLPYEYLREEPAAQRFEEYITALSRLGGTHALRIHFDGKRARILLLTRALTSSGLAQRLSELMATTLAYFPGWAITPIHEFPGAADGCRAGFLLTGSLVAGGEEPAKPLCELYLSNGWRGEYIILFRRARLTKLSTWIWARKLREEGREARVNEQERLTLGAAARSRGYIDYGHLQGERRALEEVRRRIGVNPIKVWMYISAEGVEPGEAVERARTAAQILAAASGEPTRRPRIMGVHGDRLNRTIQALLPWGPSTLLLPHEASRWMRIPRIPLGIPLKPTWGLPAFAVDRGRVHIGHVIRNGRETDNPVSIDVDDLVRHCALFGSTGSGKTTTAKRLLYQLWREGIPFLVIEPTKREYRSLVRAIDQLLVFTPGDEETAPFRLNIFDACGGVHVQTHIDNVVASFKASFPLYPPLPWVLEEAVNNVFRRRGWDPARNMRGGMVTLRDLYDEVERIAPLLRYEGRITMDIRAALQTRIRSLTQGAKGATLNAPRSYPIERLVQRPAVLELERMGGEEDRALFTATLLSKLFEYFQAQGPSQRLRYVILLEEAHRLTPNIPTEALDPDQANPRRLVVQHFTNMLAEFRAYGVGIIIVDQSPSKITPDAIRNTNTKIIHRLLHQEDQVAAAYSLGLQPGEIQLLTALQPGEAIALVEGQSLPLKVKVPDIPIDWKTTVTDIEIREAMRAHYREQPLPKPLPPITLQEPGHQHETQASPKGGHERLVREFLSSTTFMRWARFFAAKDRALLARYIARTASFVVRDKVEAAEVATRIYLHLAGEEQVEHQTLALIRQEIEVNHSRGEPRQRKQPH